MRIERKQIEELRSLTGAGVMECKRTLEDSKGDFAKALAVLDEKAKEIARQKSEREVKTGLVDSYIHGDGRIGVLIEVVCETDFLSKSRDFRSLIKDLMLQIASENPQYVCVEEVPAEILRNVEEEAALTARALGKPERVIPHEGAALHPLPNLLAFRHKEHCPLDPAAPQGRSGPRDFSIDGRKV